MSFLKINVFLFHLEKKKWINEKEIAREDAEINARINFRAAGTSLPALINEKPETVAVEIDEGKVKSK